VSQDIETHGYLVGESRAAEIDVLVAKEEVRYEVLEDAVK